jgi:hypothetical protein
MARRSIERNECTLHDKESSTHVGQHKAEDRVSAIPIDADKPAHAKLSKGEYRGPRPWDIERAIDGNVKNSGIEPYFIAR